MTTLREMIEEKDLMIRIKTNEVKNFKYMLELITKENHEKEVKIKELEANIQSLKVDLSEFKVYEEQKINDLVRNFLADRLEKDKSLQ
jgi:hypothetical protein